MDGEAQAQGSLRLCEGQWRFQEVIEGSAPAFLLLRTGKPALFLIPFSVPSLSRPRICPQELSKLQLGRADGCLGRESSEEECLQGWDAGRLPGGGRYVGGNGVEHSSESRVSVETQRPSSQHLNMGATGSFVNTSSEDTLSTYACVDRLWQQTRLKYHLLHSLAMCPGTS